MKNLINLISFLFILLVISSVAVAQEQQSKKTDATTVDYKIGIQKTVSKERQEKNKRIYSRLASGEEITELPVGVEPLPLISHWWVRLPALPTVQSTTVILGKVMDAKAYLTEDKTGIYSEFLVSVEQVFKDKSKMFSLNSVLPINRLGGSVRFASGRVNKYSIYQQGIPQEGEHYVFFLHQTEGGDFFILTAYKLTNDHIFPLDGEDNKDPKNDLPFARYRAVDKSVFFQDLRANLEIIEKAVEESKILVKGKPQQIKNVSANIFCSSLITCVNSIQLPEQRGENQIRAQAFCYRRDLRFDAV